MRAGTKHFHVWTDGVTQEFNPLEAIIGRLRMAHRETIRDIENERCFAVLDAIGICNDLANGRAVEYLMQPAPTSGSVEAWESLGM